MLGLPFVQIAFSGNLAGRLGLKCSMSYPNFSECRHLSTKSLRDDFTRFLCETAGFVLSCYLTKSCL